MKVKSLIQELYISPIGNIEVISTDKGIIAANFTEQNNKGEHKTGASSQLDEYFSGKRREFNLALDLKGTDFQKQVWQEMLQIPYGKTVTYGEIAAKIGKPRAARAVGMACNKNPLLIIIPCHRVIGANGNLTGYAGGLLKKQWLVAHENCI